jgi:hypothetical protein
MVRRSAGDVGQPGVAAGRYRNIYRGELVAMPAFAIFDKHWELGPDEAA